MATSKKYNILYSLIDIDLVIAVTYVQQIAKGYICIIVVCYL